MSSQPKREESGVESFIRQATPHVRPMLRDLRGIVHDYLPGATEEIKWGRPVYSLRNIVCYLAAASDHACLGFYRGVELEDPLGILQGSGKKLRHLKVYQSKDVDDQAFGLLLEQAASLDQD
ncbi:MAG: DUF1801 domain-containing protein [Acidobacteriota bacterium]